MMRQHFSSAILVGLTLPLFLSTEAHAADCLDFLSAKGWSAVPAKRQTQTMVWLDVDNTSDHDIVMVEGTANFVDALGNSVDQFPIPLPPDMSIPAHGGQVAELWLVGVSRLTTIDFKLVTESICVTGIVTSDGTVIRAVD